MFKTLAYYKNGIPLNFVCLIPQLDFLRYPQFLLEIVEHWVIRFQARYCKQDPGYEKTRYAGHMVVEDYYWKILGGMNLEDDIQMQKAQYVVMFVELTLS